MACLLAPVLFGSVSANGPDVIWVTAGMTKWRHHGKLEAVGQDIDGTIKPIEQLSYYKPKE